MAAVKISRKLGRPRSGRLVARVRKLEELQIVFAFLRF